MVLWHSIPQAMRDWISSEQQVPFAARIRSGSPAFSPRPTSGTAGSLRGADKERITRLFSEAYKSDPLFATKIAFYARDIRGGLGERQTFRTILQFMAKYHPEALRLNMDLVGVYGRRKHFV